MGRKASSIELSNEEREYLELQTRARTIQAQTGTYWWCERGEENLPYSIVELIRM